MKKQQKSCVIAKLKLIVINKKLTFYTVVQMEKAIARLRVETKRIKKLNTKDIQMYL